MLPADIAIVSVPPEPLRYLAIASSPAIWGPIAILLSEAGLEAAAGAAGFPSAVGFASAAGLVDGAVVASAAGLAGAGACGAQATMSRLIASSPCLRRLVLPITLYAPWVLGLRSSLASTCPERPEVTARAVARSSGLAQRSSVSGRPASAGCRRACGQMLSGCRTPPDTGRAWP